MSEDNLQANAIDEEDKVKDKIRYHLPFGGSTTSKERHNERRSLRLKEKRKEKSLKARLESGDEPSGWIDSGASSHYVAPQDKKYCVATGIASDKQVGMPNGKKINSSFPTFLP